MKNTHVLIIGFGSIGHRHYQVLKKIKTIVSITVISKRKHKGIKVISELSDISDWNTYDYFIIASETYKHKEQLDYLCSKVSRKNILVEKPLFDHDCKVDLNDNNVFVGYNLRFHPVILAIKNTLKTNKVLSVQINCGQYLPSWRPSQDYSKSYSASRTKGGGVLRDLSHELDYLFWLFGSLQDCYYINSKISDLKINSDDVFTAIGVTEEKVLVNISIDYLSKSPIRKIIVHAQDFSLYADLIKNKLKKYDKNGKLTRFNIDPVERDMTYRNMHEEILEGRSKTCTYEEGRNLLSFIDKITFKRELNS